MEKENKEEVKEEVKDEPQFVTLEMFKTAQEHQAQLLDDKIGGLKEIFSSINVHPKDSEEILDDEATDLFDEDQLKYLNKMKESIEKRAKKIASEEKEKALKEVQENSKKNSLNQAVFNKYKSGDTNLNDKNSKFYKETDRILKTLPEFPGDVMHAANAAYISGLEEGWIKNGVSSKSEIDLDDEDYKHYTSVGSGAGSVKKSKSKIGEFEKRMAKAMRISESDLEKVYNSN